MPRVLGILILATMLLPGCGDARSEAARPQKSVGGIPGCAPACLPSNRTHPGPAPSGIYSTKYFFAGRMTLRFDDGWSVTEDSTGELRAARPADPDSAILFWLDVYLLERGERVQAVPNTASGLLGRLRANPGLRVSEPVSQTIGESLPAQVVDLGIAPEATNEDPGCPVEICLELFGFPDWEGPYGIGGTDTRRLFLSDVAYGGRRHVFVVAIEGVTRDDLESFVPAAERLIATVHVPVEHP